MSIERITELLEENSIEDVESKEILVAFAKDFEDTMQEILIELRKLNMVMSIYTDTEVKTSDVLKE